MYSAYQSGQFSIPLAGALLVFARAIAARRIALASSLAEPNDVSPASTRPGSRVVISCSSHCYRRVAKVAREK